MMNLGKSLKAALKLKGVSQGHLARQTGMTLRTVNRMANKACGTVDNINALSAALGMSASEFVALGEGE